MKIVIVGIGKLGEYLAHELVNENHSVTLIDINFKNRSNIINNEDLNYICGNGLDINILKEAKVDCADLLICVMEKDEQNIMCALLGKKIGAKHTIARIRNQEYSNSIDLIKEDLGLSMIFNPDKLTANHIADIVSIPSALDATTFFKGRLHLVSIKVPIDSKLDGVTINHISHKVTDSIIICAINREGEIIIPRGTTKIKADDILEVTGRLSEIQKLLKYANLLQDKVKDVMIVGGSTTAVYLATILNDMNINTKIIEICESRCHELSEELPKSMIIHGDATNENLLFEENIESMDSFVALNNIDEENMVLSMFAKAHNVPKVITKISHINLSSVVDLANIDSVITPHKIVANQIVAYVKAMQNRKSSSCESIYKFNNSLEFIEFLVKDDFKAINLPLKKINFKENVIVVAIMRNRNIIFPSGSDSLQIGDTIIVTNKGENIKDVNDILEINYEK